MQSLNDQPNPPPNPFYFDESTIISFSGGRTSGYMLYRVLEAHAGHLPDHVKVCFTNTGKEREETLDFVQACSNHWGVHIVWLEYDASEEQRFRICGHNSARRNGEPFEEVIAARQFLPNPVTRFCTTELKIRTVKRYVRTSLGWDYWDNAIGLRYDEPLRVAKRLRENEAGRERWMTVMPLHHARVTKYDVHRFWNAQPFDLKLLNINGTTPHGNCDLCFLKKMPTIMGLIRENPASADWWIAQEEKLVGKTKSFDAAHFRYKRPSYAAMKKAVLDQDDMPGIEDDDLTECYCHD